MGLISLPTMLNNKYDSLASGIVCSSGTLGQIIPPSIVLIIIADQLASASDVANTMRQADYKLLTGAFNMPGEFRVPQVLEICFWSIIAWVSISWLVYVICFCICKIKSQSSSTCSFSRSIRLKFWLKVVIVIIPPLALIFAVLGSILMGIATVNAGSIGRYRSNFDGRISSSSR